MVDCTSSIQSSGTRIGKCEIYSKEGREEEYVSVTHSTIENLSNF